MTNFFENIINNNKAESKMTEEQEKASALRNEYLKIKEKLGFKGEIHIASYNLSGNRIDFEGEENGHKIVGYLKKAKHEMLFTGDAGLTVDGEAVSGKAANLFAEKNIELIAARAIGCNYEKQAQEKGETNDELDSALKSQE